jgi:hypothetical protein
VKYEERVVKGGQRRKAEGKENKHLRRRDNAESKE